MPQTNKLRRGRKSKKSKSLMNTKFTLSGIAKQALSALSMAKHVAGIINAEKKFFDTEVASSYNYTGAVNCITEVPGGSGPNQRNGNSVFIKGVSIRGNMEINVSATHTVLRFIVLQDLSPNPGTLTTADVLQQVGTGYAPFSNISDVNRRRFKVLATKMVTLTTSESAVPLKTYIPLSTHSRWNSATATDFDKGHIYTLCVSNQPTNSPNLNYLSRVYYYDN